VSSRHWLTIFSPILISILILVLLLNGLVDDPLLRMQIDEGLLIVLVGLALSALLTINFTSQRLLTQLHRENMAQARAETAEEHRRFLNRLDHELKNPITALRIGLAYLAATPEPEKQAEIISSIDAQALRLSHLVGDLRKLADIGARPLEYAAVETAVLLREAYSSAQDHPEAARRKMRLRLPTEPLPTLCVDADLLLLAIHNLLSNALKFTHPGDTIELSARAKDEQLRITIFDNGPGISLRDQAHIWEELYRGQDAHGIPGSGIGLALVQAIITRHEGHVELVSQPGQGTTVILELPAGKHALCQS
jgi:two-component system, OmpR family, sensor kinase